MRNTTLPTALSFIVALLLSVIALEAYVYIEPSYFQQLPEEAFNVLRKILANRQTFKIAYPVLLFMTIASSHSLRNNPSPLLTIISILTLTGSIYLSLFPNIDGITNLQLGVLLFAAAILQFICLLILGPYFMGTFGLKDAHKGVFGINKSVGRTSKKFQVKISLHTKKGLLVIADIFRGVIVLGGAGAGKSKSIIEPTIQQSMEQHLTGIVYDFKRTPLTEAAYNNYQIYIKNFQRLALKTGLINLFSGKWKQLSFKEPVHNGRIIKLPKFKTLNFSDPAYSHHVNPISPRYIRTLLDANQAAKTLAVSLDRSAKKGDFWINNAISVYTATIWHLAKNFSAYCTLPHFVEILLSPIDQIIDWWKEDEEVMKIISPLSDAIDQDAGGQVAGVISTVKLPLINLMSPEVYFILSRDDVNLQVNTHEDPTWLAIANDAQKAKAISPCISLILTLCSRIINAPGCRPCLFAIDEFPTIVIDQIEQLPATGRSNGISVLLGLQNYAQLIEAVTKDTAQNIFGNMGTQFFGACDHNDADIFVKTAGQADTIKHSYSLREISADLSLSTNSQNIVQTLDLTSQTAGHFHAKIADGKPSMFKGQMKELPDIKEYPLPLVHHPSSLQTQIEQRVKEIKNDVKTVLSTTSATNQTSA